MLPVHTIRSIFQLLPILYAKVFIRSYSNSPEVYIYSHSADARDICHIISCEKNHEKVSKNFQIQKTGI